MNDLLKDIEKIHNKREPSDKELRKKFRDEKESVKKRIAFPGANKSFFDLLGDWHVNGDGSEKHLFPVGFFDEHTGSILDIYCMLNTFLKDIVKDHEKASDLIISALETTLVANEWDIFFDKDAAMRKLNDHLSNIDWVQGTTPVLVDSIFRQLHQSCAEERLPDAEDMKIRRDIKISIAVSTMWSIARTIMGQRRTVEERSCTARSLMIEENMMGVSGTITVKLIPHGFGVLVPEPEMTFIQLDQLFYSGIEDTIRYLSSLFPDFKSKDISWKMTWKENIDLNYYSLGGKSASAAIASVSTQLLAGY